MRLLLLLVFALLGAACATKSAGTVQGQPRVEYRASKGAVEWLPPGAGLDTAVWKDSLPRDFKSGPVLVAMPMHPFPVPRSVYGTRVEAIFIVDSMGAIERISFTAVPDRAYTRNLMKSFRELRFRPAMREDGRPTRGYYLFSWDFRNLLHR